MTDPLRFAIHLPRERVIALLGSSARLDYTPPPPEDPAEKAYWLEGEQAKVTADLDRDERRIVALHLLGVSNLKIGLAYGVSRECIAQRLRRLGYVGTVNATGTCPVAFKRLERRVIVARPLRS